MRFYTVEEWLAWQEDCHPTKIDLSLDRPRKVAENLGLIPPPFITVTVAGTNGKGSTVAMLDAILREAGYKVGCYTSPHLIRYNERICICGKEVDDDTLCRTFERIDRARGPVSLTYFEFGTLAAIDIFSRAAVDIAILEVGLGGRLDAVNLLDADLAIITTIGIDHVSWLGADRESIGREKAGILRPGQPAVCGDPDPPQSVLRIADEQRTVLHCADKDYKYAANGGEWCWSSAQRMLAHLPLPRLPGAFQIQNASAVIMGIQQLPAQIKVSDEDIRQGLQKVTLAGRFQRIPGEVECILDVAHNPHGAEILARELRDDAAQGSSGTDGCTGVTHAVFGMLADKDIKGVVSAMSDVIDDWHIASVDSERSATTGQITRSLHDAGIRQPITSYQDIRAALCGARAQAMVGDRIVVFGSFYTVGEVLQDFVS